MSYLIKEVHEPDFSEYFDGDCFSKESGDYCNTIFALRREYYSINCLFNNNDFSDLKELVNDVLNDMYDKIAGIDYFKSDEQLFNYHSLPYSEENVKIIKDLANGEDYDSVDTICKFLKVKTGKEWTSKQSTGYCQRDYCTLIYCKNNYTDNYINIISDMFWGCGKEFGVIEIEDGEEIDSVYGYFIADCQTFEPTEYKRLVCEYAGIDESDTTLEMIDSVVMQPVVTYKEY